MGRTLYDQVIKKLKENKNREYLIVERSIDQVCKDDPIKLKQLYVEALDCKDSVHRIPLTIGVGSFAMSMLSLMKSMGCIGKEFDFLFFIFILLWILPTNTVPTQSLLKYLVYLLFFTSIK